ncbi:unnamed protein product [Blepharisma stoltei]|uniref:Thioredoxin domain-containing protein n=1 Tax=Blepharisma stoltei TaxID=1481888 RepID=A0AAU9KG28_9CILI|nr:unnamed protein product [Blepharisma stoltei]
MIFLYVLIAACSAEYLHLAARNHSKPYMNKSKKDWLILYTNNNAPGQLEKEFLNASKAEGTSKLTYSLFNCTKYWEVCEQFRIKELPLIHYVSRGMVKEYNWDLSLDDFIEFGQKISMPEIQQVSTVDDFEKFKRYERAFMLWTLPEFTSEAKNLSDNYFDAIAKEMQHTRIYFGRCHEEEVAKYIKVDWAQLPSVKQHGVDSDYDFNITKYTEASLRDFIENHKFGVLFNMTRGIEKELVSGLKGKLFALAVLDFSNQTEYSRYSNHMKSLALSLKKSKDWRYQFGLLDAPKFPDIADKFKAREHPQLVVVDYRKINDNAFYFGDFMVENERELYVLLNDTWDSAIPLNYTIPLDERDNYDEITIGGYLLILLVLLMGGLFIYRIYNTKEKED